MTYPNVHVRLRLAQRAPSTPPRDDELEIWLSGTKFRVRDRKGRGTGELLSDATESRGLGTPARTIEEMMDRTSEAARPPREVPPTELYGDLATDDAWVFPSRGKPFEASAEKLAPVAEQILAKAKAAGLEVAGTPTRLGRACTEYRGTVDVVEDSKTFQNVVVRVIAPPFILLDDARSAGLGSLSYVREVIELHEGGVTDADVTPPR